MMLETMGHSEFLNSAKRCRRTWVRPTERDLSSQYTMQLHWKELLFAVSTSLISWVMIPPVPVFLIHRIPPGQVPTISGEVPSHLATKSYCTQRC